MHFDINSIRKSIPGLSLVSIVIVTTFISSASFAGPKVETLLKAISESNIEQMEQVLNSSSDSHDEFSLNQRGKNGLTPLTAAVVFGSTEIIRKLIQAGTSLGEPAMLDDKAFTPFILAAQVENVNSLQALVAAFTEADYDREIQNAREFRQPLLTSYLEQSKLEMRANANLDRNVGCSFELATKGTLLNAVVASIRNESCSICFQQLQTQEIGTPKCGHSFCRACLDQHIAAQRQNRISTNCPVCRGSLDSVSVIRGDSVEFKWKGTKQRVPGYSPPPEPQTRATISGAIFTRRIDLEISSQLGEAWEDPSGLIWYNHLDSSNDLYCLNHRDAVSYCARLGTELGISLELPTAQNFYALRKWMGVDAMEPDEINLNIPTGYSPQVLPDLGSCYWSSSSQDEHNAIYFQGMLGYVWRAEKTGPCGVRCVGRR